MNILIVSQHKHEDLDAVHAADTEAAIEKLYASAFDIVIVGNDVDKEAGRKLRRILSLQSREILLVCQQAEPLKYTVAEAKFMLNNYRHTKGDISFIDINEKAE